MVVVCVEVFKRYILNAPTAWIFDAENMLYGSLFMLAGAYTLAQNAHVRGDFLYSSMRPRMQAWLDLVLYVVFFLPGIAALIYAGYRLRCAIPGASPSIPPSRRTGRRSTLQDRHPDSRRAGDAAGHRRDRALRRLPQDRANGPAD